MTFAEKLADHFNIDGFINLWVEEKLKNNNMPVEDARALIHNHLQVV